MIPSATARLAEKKKVYVMENQRLFRLTVRKYGRHCKVERNYGQTVEKKSKKKNNWIHILKNIGKDKDKCHYEDNY